jgi:acetylornithine deacetylase/succinyl-diaminopimelate desuccinylase-like protein
MSAIVTGQRAADMKAILKTPPDQAAAARLSQDPIDHSTLRTTCVATRLDAGHANNALPQRAQANVNCRIAPGHSSEEMRRTLIEIFDDPKVIVRYSSESGEISDTAPDRHSFAPPPLRPDVFQPLEKIAQQMWPSTPVIPTMATGASDSVYTNAAGMPSYQISGVAIDRDDHREHGRDERVGIASYYTGLDFYYRYLKAVTSQP